MTRSGRLYWLRGYEADEEDLCPCVTRKMITISGAHVHVDVSHGNRHKVGTARNHKGAPYKGLHVGKGIDLLAQPQKIQESRFQPNKENNF